MWQYAPARDVVQDFVDYALAWFDDRNYTLAIDADLAGWAATMRGIPGSFVNPAFDPAQSRLTAKDSFWLDVRAGSETVATCAARLFLTDDVLDLLRSLRLWFAEPPVDYGRLAIAMPPGAPVIHGRVGHEGGLWVHPQHRKRGLSAVLPHLTRAICAHEWQIDWQTGIARQGIGECGIATWAYGMPHVERCFDGYFPPTRSRERFYLVYMDREELLGGLEPETVAALLADRHQQARHTRALVMEG
jgi:GNAT superfamily N-acetyltransferase